uniref:Uncharacterized protein n=1 Tax=Elaeophora elaphi TaxID=1147741 RepID=A0A0R3RLW5_9BILA
MHRIFLRYLRVQLRSRARRCVCISITCGCYQPTSSVYRQPLLPSYRQSIYRQQPDAAAPCVTSCVQGCMQNQQNACQQSCQNSCGVQATYQQPRDYTRVPYQYEPLTHEIANGQQSLGGACINVCMPSCESQCIQRSTPVPVVPQHNSPIPVVQSQTPSYYPSQQYEPAIQQQQYTNNDNTLCIHLCMPSCESQCIERTTPIIPPYAGQTEQPSDIYYTKPTPYSPSSSYQNFIQPNQTSIVIRPQHYSGAATICIPICMPSCQTQCTENHGQSGIGGEYTNGGGFTQESIAPTQTDLLPHEISINLPLSIQQSPDCMNLCQETCMQQCVGQNQPEEQCRPSCSYTCQESCTQLPINTATASPIQQSRLESEIYETITPTSDNAMNPPLFKTFLLRSPPYYRRTFSPESSQVSSCLPDEARNGQCKCRPGYVTCLSAKSIVSQQQCCRKRR